MAASMESDDSADVSAIDERLCEIEATCPTGFEQVVQEDVREKLNCKVNAAQGKVYLFIPFKDVTKLLEMYSLDNLYVVLKHYDDFHYEKSKDAVMEQLNGIVPELDWDFGLKVWARFIHFEHLVSPNPQPTTGLETNSVDTRDGDGDGGGDAAAAAAAAAANSDQPTLLGLSAEPTGPSAEPASSSGSSSPVAKKLMMEEVTEIGTPPPTVTSVAPPVSKPVPNPLLPAFRVTCYRAGMSHSFQSPDVARSFGGAVQDYFGWNVKMKNFDIEVVINVDNNHINVALALTKQSMHRRHIVEFGHCTLRPTIAYSMLRLCNIKPTEVVCDPMCGTGSIPMEAAVNWPEAVTICGDVQKVCVQKTKTNINALNENRIKSNKLPASIDVACWDATKLPFADGHVDVFVSDMPFGKRSGSKTNNAMLYPMLFREWARTARPATGRACLLTQDRKSVQKTMQKLGKLWQQKSVHYINIGGIIAGVFLFVRSTSTDYKLTQP